jgi:hypothetical protein
MFFLSLIACKSRCPQTKTLYLDKKGGVIERERERERARERGTREFGLNNSHQVSSKHFL